MFTLDATLMHKLRDRAWLRFVDEMVAHSREFAPGRCEALDDAAVRAAVEAAIAKAQGHGFTRRGPIRLCIELVFLFGSGFDTDPQHPAIGALLRSGGDEMQRAEAIRTTVIDYIDRVCGPRNGNVQAALQGLASVADMPLRPAPGGFAEAMRWELLFMFPQKAAWIGADALDALIRHSQAVAAKHALPGPRAAALLLALHLAFGHRCTEDPLHRWIAAALTDPRLADPGARAERLEREATRRLNRALARGRVLEAA